VPAGSTVHTIIIATRQFKPLQLSTVRCWSWDDSKVSCTQSWTLGLWSSNPGLGLALDQCLSWLNSWQMYWILML